VIDPLSVLSVVAGLIYLVMGGDLLIRGSISTARRFNVPPAVVGATLVALGTSLPELIVSLLAATTDHAGLALGNVVGSNITNILLVLGVPALFIPVAGSRETKVHLVFMLIATLVFVLMCLLSSPLSRIDGAILIGMLLAAILLSASGKLEIIDLTGEDVEYERVLGMPERPAMIAFFVVFGAATLPLGAQITVRGATELAAQTGAAESAIGATIIALGTSLPELIVSIVAAMHRQIDMAIGNAVGSNTLNILIVIGVTSLVTDLPVGPKVLDPGIWFMLGASLVLAAFVLSNRAIGRLTGAIFLVAYLAFVWLVF
jgi:cation:H+ antiporter